MVASKSASGLADPWGTEQRSYPVVPESAPGWRQRLERASFRGVEFYCENTAASFGRRVAVMKMAGFDGSIQQDLGRDPVEIDLTAFVWGPDYDLLREKIETAFIEPGPAELVVPWRGAMWARVTRGPQVSESKDEGGYAAVRVAFIVEEENQVSLRARPDAKAPVNAAAVQVVWTAKESFVEASSHVRAFPELGYEKIVAALEVATDTIRRVQVTIMRAPEAVRSITRGIDELNESAFSLLTMPMEMATTLVDLMQTALALPESRPLETLVMSAPNAYAVIEQSRFVQRALYTVRARQAVDMIAAIGSGFLPNDEDSRAALGVSLIPFWIARITYTAAVCAAAQLYTQLPFDSAPAAIEALWQINEDIDTLMSVATDAEYVVLADLRASLSEYLYEEASRLREVMQLELAQDTPALLIAYTLYGDALQEEELIARNRIAEPMFVRGSLSVLRP